MNWHQINQTRDYGGIERCGVVLYYGKWNTAYALEGRGLVEISRNESEQVFVFPAGAVYI